MERRDPEELFNAAADFIADGDFDAAIAALDEALESAPEDPSLHEGLATAYFMAGNNALAVKYFQKLSLLVPTRGSTYVNLGAVYNRMGDYKKAVESLRRGLDLVKKSAEGFYNLGYAYRRQKQYALAIPAYREAIRIDPKMVEAYQNLGNVYLEMGNHQLAIPLFKKALDLKPEFEKARRGLEKAEAAALAARDAINPFGRLATPQTEAAESDDRVLSKYDRALDRKELDKIVEELNGNLNDMLLLLRDNLDVAVHDLGKAMWEPTKEHLSKAQQKFHEVKVQFGPMLKRLDGSVQRLRNHEKEMKK